MKRQLWGFLCPWTSEIFQKLKRESVHLAPSLYGEIYKYQEITAFLGSWVAPISGVPEAQGMGNPAHQLVPSHKEKPKSLFWGSVGEEVVSKPRWGIPSVSTPQHPVRGGIWSGVGNEKNILSWFPLLHWHPGGPHRAHSQSSRENHDSGSPQDQEHFWVASLVPATDTHNRGGSARVHSLSRASPNQPLHLPASVQHPPASLFCTGPSLPIVYRRTREEDEIFPILEISR